MAENSPRGRAGNGPDDEIAAAEWLFQDDPATGPSRPAANPAIPLAPGEAFDLVERPGSDQESRPPVGPPPEAPTARQGGAAARRADEASRREPEALVEEVWSRWAEWGPTLLILAAWLFALTLFLYFTWGQELYGMG